MTPSNSHFLYSNYTQKISKRSLLVVGILGFVVFSPMFSIGMTLRIDELLFLVLTPLLFPFIQRTGIPYILLPFLFLAVSLLCIYLVSQIVWGKGSIDLNWIKATIMGTVFYVYYGAVLWLFVKHFQQKDEYELVFNSAIIIFALLSLISILQVWDHKIGGSLGVIKFLEAFFPYQGTLDQTQAAKAHGFNLKMGGSGRATGTFSGHPILLGDALALVAVFFIPILNNKKCVILYTIILGALLLTLSRGSVVGYIAGVFFYLLFFIFISVKENGVKFYSGKFKKSFSLTLWLAMPASFFAMVRLFESVVWRIKGTIDSILGNGVPFGRLESVWPQALEAIRQEGVHGWLLGLPKAYEGPTDSQYFLFLVDTGIVGLLIYVLAMFALIFFGIKRYLRGLSRYRKVYLSYSSAIFSVVVLSIFHPVLQGNRFFSLLVAISVLVYGLRSFEVRTSSKESLT